MFIGAAPGLALANDWPQLGLDGARGRASSEVSGTPFTPAWQVTAAAGPIVASPTVADGYVVVAGAKGELSGLHALDGTTAWSTTVAGGFGASPAIDHGRVFASSLKGSLQSFSLATGQRIWQRAFGGQNYGSATVAGDSLVLGTGFPAQSVVRLDVATGATRWETARADVAGIVSSSPAISGNQVVFGMNGGRYQSLDLATGATNWHVDTVGAVGLSAPLVVGSDAYFVPGGKAAALYAADSASGIARVGFPVTAVDPAAPSAGSFTTSRVAVSSPVLLGGLVAFQARFEYDVKPDVDGGRGLHTMNEYLIAVDPGAMSVAWMRQSGQRDVTSINDVPELNLSPTPAAFTAAGGALVAVASSISPAVRVFDAAGNELWNATLSAPTRSSPVLANGLLLVATDAGKVHAFASAANQAPAAPTGGFFPAEGQMVDGAAPTLRWAAAQDDGAGILHYEVRVATGGDLLTSWTVALGADGAPEVTVPRGTLQANQSYVYTVRVRDPQGAWSTWSPLQTFFLAASPTVEVAGTPYDNLDQAIAAAPAGATITLGAGLLRLHAPMQLPAGVSLAGAGPYRTVVDGTGLQAGIRVTAAAGHTGAGEIRGLTLANAEVGVQVVDTRETTLRNVVFLGNTRAGLEIMDGAAAEVVNATFVRNGAGALAHGALAVRNSILTDNDTGLSRDGAGTVASRYNDLFANHNAGYQGVDPGVGDIAAVISFASPARQDFHLPMAQATTDRGDPADDFSAEPAPNGGRINIGAFGDTADAELSATPPPAVPARGATAGSGGDSAGGCALGGGRGSRAWAVAFVAAMVFASRRRRRAR